MAGNKFAAKLQRNTHKIIVILVYAVLEWILISCLLLNSFFTYLIIKFANYFGLKPPCLWCSRVDHAFDPVKSTQSYRDFVCDNHAREISNLGYCSVHGKLAEQEDMCEECLNSKPKGNDKGFEMSRRVAFFTWMSERKLENVDKMLRCSCCNGSLDSQFGHSGIAEDGDGRENLNMEGIDDGFRGEKDKETNNAYCPPSDCEIVCETEGSNREINHHPEEEANELHQKYEIKNPVFREAKDSSDMDPDCTELVCQESEDTMIKSLAIEDDSVEPIKFGFWDYCDFHSDRLASVQLIDFLTKSDQEGCCLQEDVGVKNYQHEMIDSKTIEDDKFIVDQSESKIIDQSEYTVSCPRSQEHVHSCSSTEEKQSFIHDNVTEAVSEAAISHVDQYKLDAAGIQEAIVLTSKNPEKTNDDLPKQIEANTAGHEKILDLPISVEGRNYPQKKLQQLEKNDLAIEESLYGRVVSGMEGSDMLLTIEQMREALKAERKAFRALYAELEEERNASAIAANQTMAMITRLQEEKAAMQMEALQYQRMMEEQSEYDQEALQLLNELMVKRDKEKQELEKELELYRNKVSEYEAEENMRIINSLHRNVGSRNSSASCDKSENGDELHIDLSLEAKEDDNSCNMKCQNVCSDNIDQVPNLEEMALDCVKNMTALDESLAEYEEERLCILDQLKELEDKLITLGADEGLFMHTATPEDCCNLSIKEQGFCPDFSSSAEENGFSNCLEKDLSLTTAQERLTMRAMAESLLPLLDTTDNEVEMQLMKDKSIRSESIQFQNSLAPDSVPGSKKLDLEDVVDRVHEKLQALETDGEFSKHCTEAVEKENKDMSLFHEILQNLNDLRSVEFRVRSTIDNAVE